MRLLLPVLALFAGMPVLAAAERFNHEGRLLNTELTVAGPVQFHTSQADAVVETLQIMPRTSAWNEDVSRLPLLGNTPGSGNSPVKSDAMIAMIRSDLAVANRQRLVVFKEMNYVLVPANQTEVGIRFITYPNDSDFDPTDTKPVATWPIPSEMPIETWPVENGPALEPWQRASGGDRHSIVVRLGASPRIFETWQAQLTNNTPAWQASNGAVFELDSNNPRTPGWTSGDAAGLPMFPALVRYDECVRGVIEHAVRIVVKRSRQSYLYPASHQAGSTTNVNVPAMGQRLRLKAGFIIPGSWSAQERALAVALKKYGALVADNGGFFSVSICPDPRWPANCWDNFSTNGASPLDIANFEVVEGTGVNGGPRSGGAPTCAAGADQAVSVAAGASLQGSATGTGISTRWELYQDATHVAPGTVTFGDATVPGTTATFSAAGTYLLRLQASDGVHTPAFDGVEITVGAGAAPAPALPPTSYFDRVSAEQNSAAFTLIVTGTGFVPSTRLGWSGRADLFASTATSTQLSVRVPASYLANAGAVSLTVINSVTGGGGGTSAGKTFTVTPDVTAPVISAVGASGLTSAGANIGWSTSEGATSQVEYGITGAYGTSTTVATALVTSRTVALSGLNPSTTYHYRVRSADALGNSAVSGDGTFTTSAPGGGGGGGGGGGEGGGCGLGAVGAALLLVMGVALRRV